MYIIIYLIIIILAIWKTSFAEQTSIQQNSQGDKSPPISAEHDVIINYDKSEPSKTQHIAIKEFNIERRKNTLLEDDSSPFKLLIQPKVYLDAHVTVYNDSNVAAEECQVIWDPHQYIGSLEILKDPAALALAVFTRNPKLIQVTSRRFGLIPQEQGDINLSIGSYCDALSYCSLSSVKVTCNNNIVSSTISRDTNDIIDK